MKILRWIFVDDVKETIVSNLEDRRRETLANGIGLALVVVDFNAHRATYLSG
jgi:hypothetical protein